MIRQLLFAPAVAAAMVSLSTPMWAHHSVNAQFDVRKEFRIVGVLTKIEAISPHSWFHVEVKEPDGKVTSWRLEGDSPTRMIRQGLKLRTDVKLGEVYSFRIAPAWKDAPGWRIGWLKTITINGKEFGTGADL